VHGREYKGDEESVGDFKAQGYGVDIGADIMTGERSVTGLYAQYGETEMEQLYNKGNMKEVGAGLYWGWFGEKKIEMKGRIYLGKGDYEIKREVPVFGYKTKSEFSVYNVKADIGGQYNIEISPKWQISPFADIEFAGVLNDKIKETGSALAVVEVYDDSYLKVEGKAGIGGQYRGKKTRVYGKVYGEYLGLGERGEYEGEFRGTEVEMNIWGAEQGNLSVGAAIGAEYELTHKISIYANISGGQSDKSLGYYGNVGINYRFCAWEKAKKEINKDLKEARKLAKSADKKAEKATERNAEIKTSEMESKIKIEEYKKNIEIAKEAIEEAEKALEKSRQAKERLEKIGEISEEERKKIEAEIKEIEEIANEAKTKAQKAIKEAKEGITETEEEERRKEEERIQKEISDAQLEKERQEAEARRKREMLKNYSLTFNFKVDEYFLTDESKEIIRQISEEIRELEYKKITIEGHTDNTGSMEYNKKLSRQRARSVVDEFIKGNIDEEKISYTGFSYTMPIKSNKTEEGRAANRRTEIFVE
jgi:outer membrane protein OmpA-like peptidoglycan-associated protein